MCEDYSQAEVYDKLGDALQEKGEFQEAAIAYDRASQLSPKVSWYFHKLGDVLVKQKKWLEAIEANRRAIELKPDFSWSYHNLGYALLKQEQWNEAVAAYRKAIELNPNFSWSYYNLGDALALMQEWDEASAAYFRAVAVDPNLPGIYEKFGDALRQRSEFGLEQAINYYHPNSEQKSRLSYTNLLSFVTPDPELYSQLGNALAKHNQLEGAIIFYQATLEIQPDNADVSKELERLLKKKNELDIELNSCRRAIRENPDSCWSYYNLGVALTRQYKDDEAAAAFLHAMELHPDFHWWFYYNLWEVFAKQGKLEQAVSLCHRAIEIKPDSFWPYLNLGEALTRQNKLDEAIACYQTATYKQTLILLAGSGQEQKKLEPVQAPDFIIIGSQRCGTTSLYSYLTQHPQILSPIKKEVDFWSWHFNRGIDWYLSHFPPLPQGQHFLTGEASPSYLDYRDAGQRLFNTFPKVKLIVLLRNPVDRAISQYYRWVSLNWENRSFEEAIADEVERLENNPDYIIGEEPGNYLARGMYVEFIKKWLELFPREQLLILRSEDFYEHTAVVMKQVLEFVGLPEYYISEYANYNPGFYPSVSESMRSWLSNYFCPYNQQLEDFLGIKFNWK
ncbi:MULTISPECIES: tetratricopeptide repeat-containing sulfotransferase family protein [Kamptonema]|uniref:tetratricopeptide repeat-containing sulfotransferase family protein n=1 Tax=Kamptonema TaxID=1501433 RepID=UPI0001DAC824|nr:MULTISPECIES: tetratricopeptide repeat-containing sulfotransferase family protein [Kamptonema]CBN55541.1 sulfotransferase [Kamptonema sp. PCC 6506]